MNLSRRTVLAGASAALLAPRLSQAAPSQLVVSTWGGDYADTLRDAIDQPVMKPKGVDILQDISGPVQRRTKLSAERQARRSTMDVVCLADFDLYAVSNLKALEPPAEAAVPRLAKLLPAMHRPDFIVHMYSAHVIVYNSQRVTTPPKSFADLWDPRWKARVGLSDILYTTNMVMAALVGGGSQTNWQPAKSKLRELRSLDVKILPSQEAVAAALKSEDIWFSVMNIARGYMWRQAGIPVAHAFPEEGGFPTFYGACVPRNTRNKENGFAYLNAMLEPSAQTLFAKRMGYLPTTSDVTLPEELAKNISITEAEQARMMRPDYAYLAEKQPEMLDFWNKDFKS